VEVENGRVATMVFVTKTDPLLANPWQKVTELVETENGIKFTPVSSFLPHGSKFRKDRIRE
jgi:hypothetical protein